MQFTHFDLGYRYGGEVVEVTLADSSGNVLLLDHLQFEKYRNGRAYRYFGGRAVGSPVRLDIPHAGHWHVAIDFGGYLGSLQSSVQVLPPPSPPHQAPSSPRPSRHPGDHKRVCRPDHDDARAFDVFIAYAVEDKDAVVRPLAAALRNAGLRVSCDEGELRRGGLRRTIDAGLAQSRYGIVVLSLAFFDKGWRDGEVDDLVTQAGTAEQLVFLFHEISSEQVSERSPALADKLDHQTATFPVARFAAEIAAVVNGT